MPEAADTRDDTKPMALVQLLPSLKEQGLGCIIGEAAKRRGVHSRLHSNTASGQLVS